MLRRAVQVKEIVTDCKYAIRPQDKRERVPYICITWSNFSIFTKVSSPLPIYISHASSPANYRGSGIFSAETIDFFFPIKK